MSQDDQLHSSQYLFASRLHEAYSQDLFNSSPLNKPSDPLWQKYIDPNKGDFNLQPTPSPSCSTITGDVDKYKMLETENEKHRRQNLELTKENQMLKAEIKCLKKDCNSSLVAENAHLKEKIDELTFLVNLNNCTQDECS